MELRRCPLKAHPIGKAIACSHMQNLESAIANGEMCGVAVVNRIYVICALVIASLWTEKGRRRGTRNNVAKQGGIPIYKSAGGLVPLFHELFEIIQVAAHHFLPCS